MSWAAAGGSPAGSNTQVQYNSSGSFAGSANFIWDNTNTRLGVGGNPSAPLHVQGGTASTAFDTALFGNSGGSAGASAKIYLSGANVLTRAAVIEGLVTSAGPNAHDLVFYTNAGSAAPTESMRITSGATVILKGGSTSATGVGIAFPATQSASSDANTLDDYEEGSWTPSLGGTATYSFQSGRYTKIGNSVFVQGALTVSSLGTGSASTITGLPFASSSAQRVALGAMSYYGTIASATITMTPWVDNGTTSVQFVGNSASATSSGSVSPFTNSTFVQFSGCYITNL
jgi:hypothetical protein